MDYKDILTEASDSLLALNGTILDVIDVKKPSSLEYAKQLAKVVSKLSPLLGNMIEFSTVDLLNNRDWHGVGYWQRQDPGFPDALFFSEEVLPNPGIEIKAWFPLATEITARFKDSVQHFHDDQINVALIAWLPEHVIWGKPVIVAAWVGSAASVARARDQHYHNPPDYLVFEPEDTHDRTVNLQQTNTNGYKFQGNAEELATATRIVESWGMGSREYSPLPEYQAKLMSLFGQYRYRLDTNYAKIDRIEHPGIEAFKTQVLSTVFCGQTIKQWARILASDDEDLLDRHLSSLIT